MKSNKGKNITKENFIEAVNRLSNEDTKPEVLIRIGVNTVLTWGEYKQYKIKEENEKS